MTEPARRLALQPERVAYYEKAGWEAYYDRNWLRAFWLLVRGNHELFHMSWPVALAAALDTVRASSAFAPLEQNDVPRARRYMQRFYEKARRSVAINTDAGTLAALEIEYWVVHRQLAEERKRARDSANIEPLVQSLTKLHSALFSGSPEAMRRSAELRAQAAVAVDRITGNYSTDVDADWREVQRQLEGAYRTVWADANGDKNG